MIARRGTFNDGRSAASREVAVSLQPHGLRLSDEAGGELALWPYEELRHLEEEFGSGPLRLRLTSDEGARLTLRDRAILDDLIGYAPQLARRRRGWLAHGLAWAGLTVGAVAVLLGALWYGVPRFAETATRAVPVAWEVAFGEELVERTVGLFARLEDGDEVAFCTAGPGRRVLDGLTARLSEAAGSPYPFRVHVADLELPNAFALPGGQIVLFRGLLDYVQGPDEVAGVLAHEMGHVIHRHGTEGLVKSLSLAFFFGIMLGDLGSGMVGIAGETLVSLSFSREAEHEADTSAVALLGKAGLGAKGAARFFARLREEETDLPALLELLSTHPSHESRERLFAGAPDPGVPALAAAEWAALKDICAEHRAEP